MLLNFYDFVITFANNINAMKKKYYFILIGALLGAVTGFMYWKFFGCENGCPIKSNWYTMVPYSTLIGALFGNLVSEFVGKKNKN